MADFGTNSIMAIQVYSPTTIRVKWSFSFFPGISNWNSSQTYVYEGLEDLEWIYNLFIINSSISSLQPKTEQRTPPPSLSFSPLFLLG